MKNKQNIFLFFSIITMLQSNITIHGLDLLSKVGIETAKTAAAAAPNLGSNFGLGTLKAIGAAATKAGTAIAASPATPVVLAAAGAGAGGYVAYRGYRHFNPSIEDQIKKKEGEIELKNIEEELKLKDYREKFGKCLSRNLKSSLNKGGFPNVCTANAAKLAIFGGGKEAADMIAQFQLAAGYQ